MLKPPTLPLGIRAANAAAGALQPLGFQRRYLDKANLLDTARRNTGLEDFGDPGFESNLDRLLDALKSEAQLTPLGRLIAREEILTPLCNDFVVGFPGWVVENNIGLHGNDIIEITGSS